MNINTAIFRKKVEKLKTQLLGKMSFAKLQALIETSVHMQGKYVVFLSICNKKERAKVLCCAGVTVETAWKGVCAQAEKYIEKKNCTVDWLKADIMCSSQERSLASVIEEIANDYNEYFRYGLSFDSEYRTAMIEAELNGNRVITYKKKNIELEQVNKYISKARNIELQELPETVIVFDCISAFCDDKNQVYSLYSGGYDCGRRVLERFDKETALEVITTSSEYLAQQLDENGKFEYGVYPVYHKYLPGYNILRHASSIWSLVCACRITQNDAALKKVEQALGYLKNEIMYIERAGETVAYLVEREKDEIKLGANAVSILVMSEFMDVTGSDAYKELCCALGNGILSLFEHETGEFTHVLNATDLSVKEKMRTVYYDGEAVFALARLYGLTKDEKWLNAAATAVDRFIREDYTKHRDHWVAYSVNELTKYLPKKEYLEFGLLNAQKNLNRIYNQKTTYHTYLELLCVTFELYDRIIESGIELDYLKKFDVDFFVKTLFHRAEFMLNGYCYPEYVMYLKYPDKILGAFFVRHDGYRIRIDDIQHFCGAYYSLYRNYEKLDKLR